MKRALFAVTLAALAAGASAQTETQDARALRGECSSKYTAKLNTAAPAANEYQFVYYKGAYKGEQVAGTALDCTEQQYAAYLNTVDPTRVMSAYPTAAGRPMVKPADAKK